MFQASWVGALGLAGLALAWGIGILVLRAGVDRAPNRRVAALLFAEGLLAGTGTGLVYLLDSPTAVYVAQYIGIAAMVSLPWLNLELLALLNSPLRRVLRARAFRAGVAALTIIAMAALFLSPSFFVEGLTQPWYAAYDVAPGPGFFVAFGIVTLINLFAVVLGLVSMRRTSGSARERARAFVAAYGTRDILVLVAFVIEATLGPRWLATVVSPPIIILAYVPILAYGILHAQVFDIDLRIKRGVSRGTIFASFVAVFFVASEATEAVLETQLGPVVGLLAAGGMALASEPLGRVSQRVADAVMPGVTASPGYLDSRKEQVYRSACEGSLEDGAVTTRERRLLLHLRESLGLTEEQTAAIESSVWRVSAQ